MDKFIIGDNPLRDNPDTWIVHMLPPQAHIQCIEGHVQTDRPHKHYSYRNGDDITEEWTLSAHFFFTTDFISEPEKQVLPLLDRAWRWYRSYMQWEDDQIKNEHEK